LNSTAGAAGVKHSKHSIIGTVMTSG
jgi:hypothetical protein